MSWPMNPRDLQVSASPALALWVTATLSASEFLKHGHWLSNSVLPTHGAPKRALLHADEYSDLFIQFFLGTGKAEITLFSFYG